MSEGKVLKLELYEKVDYYEGTTRQMLKTKDGEYLFSVENLNECPEDAIIGRDLFSAQDYAEAIEKGMELARQGYTHIDMELVCEDGDF